MPLKLFSEPIGNCAQTGRPPTRVLISRRSGRSRRDLVHLIDEHDARHMIFVGLAPNGLCLRFDALIAVENANRAVEHAQRTLDLDGEVDMAGVSMMLRRLPFQIVVVAAEVMVMPRSCSCSIQSIVAAPSCTSPILWLLPE